MKKLSDLHLHFFPSTEFSIVKFYRKAGLPPNWKPNSPSPFIFSHIETY